ncbi:MAG: response regulator [Chloroflexota bacterium]|nr:response regulator [Chloroflexota bacterium]
MIPSKGQQYERYHALEAMPYDRAWASAEPGKAPTTPGHRNQGPRILPAYSAVGIGMKKILIVDDEEEIVALLAMLLDGDASVLSAYDGEQALEMVREHQPELVLTDVMMPRLDGRALCRLIRSDPATARTRVILMSAGRWLDAGECGADGLIHKPFDIPLLLQTVSRYLKDAA